MTKGVAPAHVQKPMFTHPAKATCSFIGVLEDVPDPRGPSPNFTYSLTTILFIVVVAMLCGGDDWEEIATIAQEMEEWLGQYIDVSAGIPSSFTLERVISLIEPKYLEEMVRRLGELLRGEGVDRIIGIDGKTLCGSADWSGGRAVHLLHAWSCENRVCLAQVMVNEKSNEIPAMLELLDKLMIKDSIITADALHTQRATVEKIVGKGGHYVLPVKDNQPGLLASLKLLFSGAEEKKFIGIDADSFEWVEKSRGRVEERIGTAIDASELTEAQEWKGLRTALKLVRRRTVDHKTSEETVYYISDLDLDASRIGKAIREHWGIENRLHHALDVVFEEDAHIYRNKNGAANLSALRKVVLMALEKTESKKKRSKKAKRLIAVLNPQFRAACLKFIF